MKAEVLSNAIILHRYLSDIAADYISQRKRLRKLKEGIIITEVKFYCNSSVEETFKLNSHNTIDATPFLEAIDNEIEYIKEEIRDIEREFPMIEFETILEEQNPVDKTEPKFKVGNWVIISTSDGEKVVQIDSIEYFKDGKPMYITSEGRWFGNGTKAHLWTIQDAKDGDVLCYKDEISLYKHDIKNCTKQETTFGGFVYHCCYDGKGFIMDSLYSLTEQDKMDIHPATKEQRDLLFSKMKEAGYEWDAEKKELRKIEEEVNGEDYGIDSLYHAQIILEKTLGKVDGYQSDDGILDHKAAITAVKKLYEQKSAWSQEDERIYQSIMDDTVQENQLDGKQIDWLRNIKSRNFARPQNTWKPSEEMLEALYKAIPENVMAISEDEMLLDKLYQGLKYGRVLSNK